MRTFTKRLIKFYSPQKRTYIGKVHSPLLYFYPRGYVPWGVQIVLIDKKKMKVYPHKPLSGFRSWYKSIIVSPRFIINIRVGFPLAWESYGLGWKWKYDTIRYEWNPGWALYILHWKISQTWGSSQDNMEDDEFWEQVLWLNHCGGLLQEAKKTWPWKDMKGNSTWKLYQLIQ